MQTVPLFPLHTVLYPDGQLPLRIFEPRYVDMVSECLKTNSGFGVCLIKQGAETGSAATCFNIGTYAEIIDFSRQTNGLLTITIQGKDAYGFCKRLYGVIIYSQGISTGLPRTKQRKIWKNTRCSRIYTGISSRIMTPYMQTKSTSR